MNRTSTISQVAVLFTLLFGFALAHGASSPATHTADGTSSNTVLSQFEYLDDSSGALTFDQVLKGEAGQFSELKKKNIGFGHAGVRWFRFSADINVKEPFWFLTQKYEHIVDFTIYYPRGDTYESLSIKKSEPLAQRQLQIHNLVFQIPTPTSTPVTYYIRYENGGHALALDIAPSDLNGLIKFIQDSNIAVGLFFGATLAMWFYNLLLLIILRDKAYLYYTYYLTCLIVVFYYLNGFSVTIAPLNSTTDRMYAAAGFGALHGMSIFARYFLSLRNHLPRFDSYLKYCGWAWVLGCIASFVVPLNPFQIINPLIIATVPALMLAGAIRWYQGYLPARLYFIGWLIFVLSLGAYSLRALGVLPTTWFTVYGVQVGSVMEAILFAMALAGRIKVMENESKAIREEQTKREAALLEGERAALETRVQERTLELDKAYLRARKAEDENKELLKHAKDSIETERKRIALELHDSVNAALIAIRLRAEAIAHKATVLNAHDIAKLAGGMIEGAGELYNSTRKIVEELRPELLTSLGFVGAVRAEVAKFQSVISDCTIALNVGNFDPLNDAQSIVGFRVVQESLSNIAKYASASAVTIVLEGADSPWAVRITISDNGRGMEASAAAKSDTNERGYGLAGMRERVESINGVFGITSSANGTIVSACI